MHKTFSFFRRKNKTAFLKLHSFQSKAQSAGHLESDKRAQEAKSVGAALITQLRQAVEIAKLQIGIICLAIQ